MSAILYSFILSFRTEKILKDSGVAVAPPARSVGKGGVATTSASTSVARTISKPLTHKCVAEVVEDEDSSDDRDGDDENQKAGNEDEDDDGDGDEDGDKDGDGDEDEDEDEEEKKSNVEEEEK